MKKYKNILLGVIISYSITIAILIVYSLTLASTNISEKSIDICVYVVSGFSIFLGALIANMKLKKNGTVNGIIIGFIYIVSLFIVSSLANNDYSINLRIFIAGLIGVTIGALGGMVGVNIKN